MPSAAHAQTASSLGILFRQVRDAMWARMADELVRQGHELTFSQYITLKRLAHGVASGSELARAADLNPGAMTRLLDRLAEKGLVERREADGETRSVQLSMSYSGWQKMTDLMLQSAGHPEMTGSPALSRAELRAAG